MKRARLMAIASLRWCLEHTPERLRGTIFEYEEVYRVSKGTFLKSIEVAALMQKLQAFSFIGRDCDDRDCDEVMCI